MEFFSDKRRERVLPGCPWIVREYRPGGVDVRLFGKVVRSRTWRERGFRLGASYNLYDGEELLAASIRSIRPQVDFVTVVYQDVSNFGERREPSLAGLLEGLRRDGLVDSIVRYEPDLTRRPFVNEHRKRVMGVEESRRHGCTHHLDMDVDEFYRADELARAKEFVFSRGIDCSAAHFRYYVKSPRWQMQNAPFFVPFVFRIPRRLPERTGDWFPCQVDMTRILRADGRFYMFREDEIVMHHMSTVRRDIARKYRNSSASESGGSGETPGVFRFRDQALAYSFGGHALPPGYDCLGRNLIRLVDDVFEIGDVGGIAQSH